MKPKKFENSVPYLDIEAVEKNNILQYADTYSTVLATEGDIFVVWDGSRSGLVAKGMVGAVGSTIMRLTPILINRDYLFYYLKSNYENIQNNTIGASIPHVNAEFFYNLNVPLPPVEEQERIVSQIKINIENVEKSFIQSEEKLINKLKNLLDDDSSEIESIGTFKKIVLEKALTGKLTENWRHLRSLDYDWKPNYLKDCVDVIKIGPFGSLLNQSEYIKKGIPIINPSHIVNLKIVFDENITVATNKALKLRDYTLRKDDIVMARRGEMGRCALVTANEDGWICGTGSLFIRPKKDILNSTFLVYSISSEKSRKYFNENAVGTTMKNLNIDVVEKYIISIPSIEEQQEIVNQIEKLFLNAKELEEQFPNKIFPIDKLLQSVLQRAFTEHYFTYNSNDETVSILFKRVKIEKEKIEKERKELQKSNLKIRSQMDETTNDKKTILDILRSADNQILTVEELWKETPFSKTNEVESFYEELIELEQNEKIEVSWVDNSKKIYTNIKLKENAN